ncbi:hypothetical protein OO013_10020 [Mangrovivirga sp. M17]|uniref:VLRF1 domain-containing protein n=1 Tax=Mangrovivirga halotolerans TaxID=2993936 RepID=A0ABT3RQZ6_9BACT|nr:hypothetical protein [Mangrovivirga halotolerans]MCX2744203.1 hypothetical protein [Mangrovivirga halotolerans]
MKRKELEIDEINELLFELQNDSDTELIFEDDKWRFTILKNGSKDYLRIPITTIFEKNEVIPVSRHFIIALIETGHAALALCDEEEILNHKVFKSYMVRKKQGKSQLKYLKTKGKSRAGSRVRLANALEFFENINTRLNEYEDEYSIDIIALSCNKTILPFLFNSKVEPPFEKKDDRLYKIPKYVDTPGYEEMLETYEYLISGELFTESNDFILEI